MMGVDDKRALPEYANAMMCCDDKQLAVDAFVAMTDEEAVAPPLLMDLIYMLQGKVFHQQIVNGGGNRKEVLTRLTNEVVQTQSPSDVLILIRANGLRMDDLTFMMDANLGELDGRFCAVCDSVEYGDEMIKHLGDSRVYLYRNGWHCLTKDHSFINELKAQNLADDSDHASCYGALTGYFCVDELGDESAVTMASQQKIKLEAGECLLLCSDGFCDVLKGNFLPITKDLPLKEWLNDSIKQLKQSGAKAQLDNVSLVVVRCMT